MELKTKTIIIVNNKPYVVMGTLNKYGVNYCALTNSEDGSLEIFAKSGDELYPVTDQKTIEILMRYFSKQIAETTDTLAKIILENKKKAE